MATTVQTDNFPKGTRRHLQTERLHCPRCRAEVSGYFCFTFCGYAVLDECERFSCELLDGTEASRNGHP